MYVYKNSFTGDNFQKYKDHYAIKKYISYINERCDRFRGTPIEALTFSKFSMFDKIGDRRVYEQDYFTHRERALGFILRAWLYREEDDIKELEDVLWAICDEYSWALPAHLLNITIDENIVANQVDLFASETAHMLAETLSMCGDYIHPAVKRRCIEEIFKRVIEPFETKDIQKHRLGWEFTGGNWSAVCGGAVGMTAIYVIEDEERLKKIIERVRVSCNRFIDTCEDDGVCGEGISYWAYAMRHYVSFDELMKERFGESIVADKEKFRKVAEFPSIVCMENRICVNFSDMPSYKMMFPFGIMAKLNECYGVPIPEESYYFNSIGRYFPCEAIRDIEWLKPELLHNSSRKDDVFLPIGQWLVKHNENMSMVIKGGHNDEPHNHNDIGSYMFIKDGCVIADDLGAQKYTKAYFDENRYNHLNTRSKGHSVPIVNGCEQLYGREYAADKFEQMEKGAKISFAGAYDSNACLKSLIREASLDESGMTVKDRFMFKKNRNTITERILTKLDAKVTDEKTVSLLKDGDAVGALELLSDGKIKLLNDSYLMQGVDEVQEVTVIEIEISTETDRIEIEYCIR